MEVQWVAIIKRNSSDALGKRSGKTTFTFATETAADNRLIGEIFLMNCNWTNRSAILGVGVWDPKNREKGYG
jgi:RimJ/RimL family protein N-acetyltransferase